MSADLALLPAAPANDQDLGDLLTAAQSMIKHAKANFDREGKVDASRLMIPPLNALALAIERRLADLCTDDWKPISTLMNAGPGIVLWQRPGKLCPLNPETGPLILMTIREGTIFTHWRRFAPPKAV